ncbi:MULTISPECIES: nickel-responsive transcriptional regulator NikR [Paenibacillus]|uniref:Putative nickel-responsive regulator n=1 Tax=Paenibacillus pabuli TaxID=1472 RepID=A0A855Y6F6_9BACL|nr:MULTISPECIES: nickel-responsive transcriptional regulator NikR [Paenibacillus]PWW45051.1 CopG family transcriptional regulator [Paenibacillus pabuli]PXW11387.1 CopG family transcriptional regulator [Paenibacillus taichungensis]
MADKEDLTRFGVAFPTPLIEQFDSYIEEQGYKNRSEAFRDLVRKTLLEPSALHSEQDVAGTIVMVYDHHISDLPIRLMELQHEAHHDIISNMHVHLNHDQCLEVIAVRGNLGRLRHLHQQIQVQKGVLYAELSVTYVDELNKMASHHSPHNHDHSQNQQSHYNPHHSPDSSTD